MFQKTFQLFCLTSAVWAVAPIAKADLILDPAAVSTNMGTFSAQHVPVNVINQSGLSVGYTSLVTDFTTYISSNPTHNTTNNDWFSTPGTITGNFDFDLGGAFTIEALSLWDIGGNNNSSLVGFTLLAGSDATFSSSTVLGTFSANPNTGPLTAALPQVFNFSPTAASFVRMQITSNNGAGQTGFGEAAFAVVTSPEPASIFLCGAAFALAIVCGKRYRARA